MIDPSTMKNVDSRHSKRFDRDSRDRFEIQEFESLSLRERKGGGGMEV